MSQLHLYDTATRSLRTFEPLEPGKVSIYLCGLTVQGPPHIGHVRNWIDMDILRRWLTHSGYEVSFVRNVTDIDDKIIVKSAVSDEPWWSLAFRNEREIIAAEQALGCLPPSYEPRATGHVPEMIELMHRLIDSGHAYVAGGDVYFDVASYPEYGSLSGQRVDEMQPAGDSVGDDRKRDPRDFALWKAAKEGEPYWPTPWGNGRPGWHLECSAMATKYLGPMFDIHGGGLDLVFPHHENELAQSRAVGDGFARYWMHNGLVTMSGEKMSKSLGNTLQVREIVRQWRPVEVRYYLGAAHYRSTMEFSPEALDEAAAAYRRIENFLARTQSPDEEPSSTDYPLPTEFVDAMNDDLGVPSALAVLHTMVREGNAQVDSGKSAAHHRRLVQEMSSVLGINPAQWPAAAGDRTDVIDALVGVALEQRAAARSRKDYAASDAIRDRLSAAGVKIEDTPDGPRWSVD
ncbi:cysteine--tRNA ligase [uncultured Jatrophihabitans sp.]|uniref:cysteine--tRNA ligase n=1 Tax=uncultured Jatrophihabitans sp. TaxID=1610747 RepID=UPI0035CB1261